MLFGCRELVLTPARRRAAARVGARQPWGPRQWERLAEGESFDGMESWLPLLSTTRARSCPTCCGAARRLCWSSPGASATAPSQLLDEEAALAETLAVTWGVGPTAVTAEAFPRLHLPFERLLSESPAGVARPAAGSRGARARRR